VVFWLLLACADEAPAGESGVPPQDGGGYDADALAGAIEDALNPGLPVPRELHDAYLERFAEGDESCPGDATQLTGAVPPEGCTAESGAFYTGVSMWHDDGVNRALSGDFEITSAEGLVVAGGGFVNLSDDGSGAAHGEVFGTWRWEGSVTGWEQGVSAAFVYDVVPDDGLVRLSGPLSVRGQAIDFVDTEWNDGCERATGALEVRDDAARWYAVAFDGCTGCGPASVDGEELGEVCVDLSAFRDTAIATLGPA